jgi:BirA family biotin operon repressor/biotin-[acetyl-CoA-carboxylase] ligase
VFLLLHCPLALNKIIYFLNENLIPSKTSLDFDYFDQISPNSTQYHDSTELETSEKEEIFERLILELNSTYLLIQNKEFSRLKENYLNSLWLLGVESTFEINNSFFKGIIRGTDAFGRLEIEDVDGVKTYDLKEIKFTLRNEL